MEAGRNALLAVSTATLWPRSLGPLIVLLYALVVPPRAAAQEDTTVRVQGDSVTIRLIDVDVRAAVQSLAQYLDRPVTFGSDVTGARVTIETPQPVPRGDVVRLLRAVLESQNFEFVTDTAAGIYTVRARQQRGAAEVRVPGGPPPGPAGGVAELFVIQLRHARAVEVAATVNALYGRASALGEIGARATTLTEELRQGQVPPVDAPPEAVQAVAGRPATLAGETSIVPDPRTNSLLIRASRSDFTLISAVVERMDVRPLQVLIEVLIAEVRSDRAFSFGVEAAVPPSRVPGVDHVIVSATQKGIGLGDFAMRVLRSGPGLDFDATLRAAASRGDARILSRPVVIAANNEPAEILVGSQRPFVQVQRSLPTDAPARDQVVQYKDVGTRLVVTPIISADGYVALDVTQEVNAATAETQFDAPIISTRTVRTRLLVRDGQTVVMGGLSDRQRERTQGGVPILSSIPILGGLFGRASQMTTETEFFLFITTRVLRNDADAEGATDPYRRRARRATP